MLSSSDGQRFPVSGKIRNAQAIPRYYGYGKGYTLVTHSSDQYAQYGSKSIPSTIRDATYVLDSNLALSNALQTKHVTHELHVWNGRAHQADDWHKMVQLYL